MAVLSEFIRHVSDDLLVRLGVDYFQRRSADAKDKKDQPLKLPGVLLRIADSAQKKEREEWLKHMMPGTRKNMEQMSEKDLDRLLAIDSREERDGVLEATLEESSFAFVRHLKNAVEGWAPEAPKTAANLHNLTGRFGHKAFVARKQQREVAGRKPLLIAIWDFTKDCCKFS